MESVPHAVWPDAGGVGRVVSRHSVRFGGLCRVRLGVQIGTGFAIVGIGFLNHLPNSGRIIMESLILFAAAGYSLIYMLMGGGLVRAAVIFVVAKMLGR